MPSDDYTAVGGGGLRIKGAKIMKKKKKKDKGTSSLEKNLDDASSSSLAKRSTSPSGRDEENRDDNDEEEIRNTKTDSELRHEEFKKKRLLKMAQEGTARPELLKTHKERVEELNTYLSKLSEHHDMPKIGPG